MTTTSSTQQWEKTKGPETGITSANSVLLSTACDTRREPDRPLDEREPGFLERYDDDTLFFDAFWAPSTSIFRKRRAVALGPPVLNHLPLPGAFRITYADTAPQLSHEDRPIHTASQTGLPSYTGNAAFTNKLAAPQILATITIKTP